MAKRVRAAVIVSMCILSAAAGTTWSYLTSQDQADNTFDTAKVDTPVEEEFPDPGTIVPGTKMIKSPRLKNDGDVPCYARMKVVFTNEDAGSLCEPLVINAGWSLEEDGYYYWQEALPVGASSASLFDFIKVRENAAPEDIVPFDVLVYGESTASEGKTAEEAWADMDRRNP